MNLLAERLQESLGSRTIRWLSDELTAIGVEHSAYSSVYRYVHGDVLPSIAWVQEAARVLGVDVAWLVEDRDEDEELPRIRRPRMIYTAGVFDLLHGGHLSTLWASAALGDVLIVGVVADASYKNVRPEQAFLDRFSAISRLPFVDLAVRQEGTDPSDNLRRYRPDVMTHGADWTKLQVGHETLEELGIEWVLTPVVPGISSTILREEIRG